MGTKIILVCQLFVYVTLHFCRNMCNQFQTFRDIEFYAGRSYFKMYIVLASIASSDSCGLRYLIFLEIGMSAVCKKEFL